MYTVIEKETGMPVVVYGVNGAFFLIYDDRHGWGYKHMDCFRPAQEKDIWKEF